MLVIKKELSFYEFIDEFIDVLEELDLEAMSLIYESLCEVMEGGADDTTIRDYIRFQLEVQAINELINNYDVIIDDDMTEDEKHEAVENYLNYNTYLLGSYINDNGVMVYVFDEF